MVRARISTLSTGSYRIWNNASSHFATRIVLSRILGLGFCDLYQCSFFIRCANKCTYLCLCIGPLLDHQLRPGMFQLTLGELRPSTMQRRISPCATTKPSISRSIHVTCKVISRRPYGEKLDSPTISFSGRSRNHNRTFLALSDTREGWKIPCLLA
jgi:hypothetical protein